MTRKPRGSSTRWSRPTRGPHGRAGSTVLGLVHGPALPAPLVESAIDAGLDGLVLEGAFPGR